MNKNFYKLVHEDALVRAHFDAWTLGRYHTFEEMLVDLVVAQSMNSEKLFREIMSMKLRDPSGPFVFPP